MLMNGLSAQKIVDFGLTGLVGAEGREKANKLKGKSLVQSRGFDVGWYLNLESVSFGRAAHH